MHAYTWMQIDNAVKATCLRELQLIAYGRNEPAVLLEINTDIQLVRANVLINDTNKVSLLFQVLTTPHEQ